MLILVTYAHSGFDVRVNLNITLQELWQEYGQWNTWLSSIYDRRVRVTLSNQDNDKLSDSSLHFHRNMVHYAIFTN